jgi:hypothetical protein
MDRYFKRLAEDVYTEFLTKTELESVIKGDDMWMDSHELVKRLDANNHDYIYTGQDLDEILGRDPDEISDEMEDASKPKQRAKKKVTKKKASRKKTASD